MVKLFAIIALYVIVGSVVTFIVCRWKCYDTDDAIGIGITWPLSFPFSCAIYFADKLNRRK